MLPKVIFFGFFTTESSKQIIEDLYSSNENVNIKFSSLN